MIEALGGDAGTRVGVIVIGRNEGDRLKACLRSLPPGSDVVYVDSGSTDDSVAFAHSLGFRVVELSTERGFTAARARNAGLDALAGAPLTYVQMVDGDCEVDAGWIATARAALDAEPDLAVVFGRRRERFPERSVYNRLCDEEWDVPVGEARSCGGDALFRLAPLLAVGGYNGDIIAGEEPDLCFRLRGEGWRIRRIAAEMTRHDAAITRYSQWWRRALRSGHAFAENHFRHPEDAGWADQVRNFLFWGGKLPAAVIAFALAGIVWPPLALVGWALALLYPLKVGRLAWRRWRDGTPFPYALVSPFFLTLSKFAQLVGWRRYHRNRRAARASTIIEYKSA
jgi:glycosyltransferase involved in cell wall biosynthesis